MKKIDVVLTTYNYSLSLQLCLEGFTRQTLPKDQFRIIVIDDGSHENIEAVVDSFSDVLNILYHKHENRGRVYTRNKGLELATADIIVWNESDRVPCLDFLYHHLMCHAQFPNSVVTGRMKDIYFTDVAKNRDKIREIVENDSRLARELVNSRILNHLFAENGESLSAIPWVTASSGNMSFPRTAVKGICFDDRFTGWALDNYEFGYQLFKSGCSYIRAFHAKNYHIAHPRNKQQYVEGIRRSMEYFTKKHPHREVDLFEAFMIGELSLQDYEEQVGRTRRWTAPDDIPLFNKIINF